jgi:hypothetical protein
MVDPVFPASYIPTILQPPKGSTEESQKQLQAYANALLTAKPSERKPGVRYTWANGLSDASNKILGAMLHNQATQQQLDYNKANPRPVPTPGTPPGMLSPAPTPGGGPATPPLSSAPALSAPAIPPIINPSNSVNPWANPYGTAT